MTTKNRAEKQVALFDAFEARADALIADMKAGRMPSREDLAFLRTQLRLGFAFARRTEPDAIQDVFRAVSIRSMIEDQTGCAPAIEPSIFLGYGSRKAVDRMSHGIAAAITPRPQPGMQSWAITATMIQPKS